MRPLANLLDEFRAYLNRSGNNRPIESIFAKGWKIVTTEHVLPDLTDTAAVAAVFPAGCIPLGVSGRVDTAVTTDSAGNAFNVGITGGDADAFGADVAGAVDTQWDNADFTASPVSLFSTSAQGVTIDPTGAEAFTAGAVTFYATYLAAVAPVVA